MTDFRKIQLKDIEGNAVELDLSRQLGNLLYMSGRNIDECELGKKIYYDGAVELSEENKASVLLFAKNFPYVTQRGIEEAINGKGDTERG